MTNTRLENWIKLRFTKRATINKRIGSSYGMKHIYERETGEYVTNLEFRTAMTAMGFAGKPIDANYCDPKDWNEHYNVSTESYNTAKEIADYEWGRR